MRRYTALLLTILIMASCKKEEVGGNAGIETIVINNIPNWQSAGQPNLTTATVDVQQITQDAIDKGLIFVYYTTQNNGSWVQLPYASGNIKLWFTTPSTGKLQIFYEHVGGGVGVVFKTIKVIVVKPI